MPTSTVGRFQESTTLTAAAGIGSNVLLDCRKYRQLRQDLLGPGYKTLGEVLSIPKLTLKAAEFMVATRLLGQFRRPDKEEIYNE